MVGGSQKIRFSISFVLPKYLQMQGILQQDDVIEDMIYLI